LGRRLILLNFAGGEPSLYPELTGAIVKAGFGKSSLDIDGWVLMAGFARIIQESYPELWYDIMRKVSSSFSAFAGMITKKPLFFPFKHLCRLKNLSISY
jgi:hypothetical protein